MVELNRVYCRCIMDCHVLMMNFFIYKHFPFLVRFYSHNFSPSIIVSSSKNPLFLYPQLYSYFISFFAYWLLNWENARITKAFNNIVPIFTAFDDALFRWKLWSTLFGLIICWSRRNMKEWNAKVFFLQKNYLTFSSPILSSSRVPRPSHKVFVFKLFAIY